MIVQDLGLRTTALSCLSAAGPSLRSLYFTDQSNQDKKPIKKLLIGFHCDVPNFNMHLFTSHKYDIGHIEQHFLTKVKSVTYKKLLYDFRRLTDNFRNLTDPGLNSLSLYGKEQHEDFATSFPVFYGLECHEYE